MLISICLIFCQFQSGVAYKHVAYKKKRVVGYFLPNTLIAAWVPWIRAYSPTSFLTLFGMLLWYSCFFLKCFSGILASSGTTLISQFQLNFQFSVRSMVSCRFHVFRNFYIIVVDTGTFFGCLKIRQKLFSTHFVNFVLWFLLSRAFFTTNKMFVNSLKQQTFELDSNW